MARKEEHKDLILDHDVEVGRVDIPIDDEAEAEEATEPGKAPVEHWAERKGFLPQFISTEPMRPNPEYPKFAAAKVRWAPGTLVTEAEFDEAIKQQGEQAIR